MCAQEKREINSAQEREEIERERERERERKRDGVRVGEQEVERVGSSKREVAREKDNRAKG